MRFLTFVIILTGCTDRPLGYNDETGDTANPLDLAKPPSDMAVLSDLTIVQDFANPPDLEPDCTGRYGVCAAPGILERLDTGLTCSSDVGGSASRATAESCDGEDNDCDGFIDQTCPSTLPGSGQTPINLSGSRVVNGFVFDWTTKKGEVVNPAFIRCLGYGTVSVLLSIASHGQVQPTFPDTRVGASYTCQIFAEDQATHVKLWSEIISISF